MRSSQLFEGPELPVPLFLQPIRNARRMRLRFDETRQVAKLTYPRGMSKRRALAWAIEQREWVEAQLRAALPAEPFVPGAMIPLGDGRVELRWVESEPRVPRLAGSILIAGGPLETFSRRIEAYLRKHALDVLSRDTAEIAPLAGVKAVSVSVGDARTRWGSCSSSGQLRYSWRLICAPVAARRYVVAHEVAHLVHLNHGREFKELEARLYGGDVRAAQALLRQAGPRLRRIGLVR